MGKNTRKRCKKFRTWAPGKVMLLGEHAVVYGYSCLSFAIDKGVTVTISKEESDRITSDVADTRFTIAARETFRHYFSQHSPVSISIKSDISGFGLGSSSAVTVAIVSAMMGIHGIPWSFDTIFEIAYQAVKSVQKNASGYDVATSLYGGMIEFNGETKKVKQLPVSTFPFLVGFTGYKADTSQLVEDVSQKRKANKEAVDTIFADISRLVDNGKKALLQKDWVSLGKYMNENQQLLEHLGVSTPVLDAIIKRVKESVFGVKIAGAGGGDCIIALIKKKEKKNTIKAMEESGAKNLPMTISPKGVHLI